MIVMIPTPKCKPTLKKCELRVGYLRPQALHCVLIEFYDVVFRIPHCSICIRVYFTLTAIVVLWLLIPPPML